LRPEKVADTPPPDPAEPPPAPPQADDPVISPPEPAAGPAGAEALEAAPERIKLRVRIPIKPADGEEPPGPASPALPPEPAQRDVAPVKEIPRPEVPTGPLDIGESLPPVPMDLPLPRAAPAPLPGGREEGEVVPRIKLKSGVVLPADFPPAGGETGAAAVPAGVEKKAARQHGDFLGVFARVAGLVLVLAVVYLGYRRYSQVAPHQEEPAPAGKISPLPGSAKAAPAPQSTMGRAVQKARDAAAASEKITDAVNEVIGAPASPAPAAPSASPPHASPPAALPAPASLPPISPRSASPLSASSLPGQRFRALIDGLKIAGVRVGPPARLFLGGITYQAGDVIDGSLGVVFVGVDAKTNELVFKDGTGTVIRRPF